MLFAYIDEQLCRISTRPPISMVVYFLQNGSVEPCLLLSTDFVLMRVLMLDKTASSAGDICCQPGAAVCAVKLGVSFAVTSQVNSRLQIDGCQILLCHFNGNDSRENRGRA